MAKPSGWENIKDWADEATANAYRGLSVNTRVYRTRLRTARRSFCDPNVPDTPKLGEVDKTAAWVSEQVGLQTGIRSGIASLAGAVSIPPEVLLTLVTYVRLAQKLTIVYGFDPHSDTGQMVMWRALAAGLETELPEQGPLGMRLRDLTRLFFNAERGPSRHTGDTSVGSQECMDGAASDDTVCTCAVCWKLHNGWTETNASSW